MIDKIQDIDLLNLPFKSHYKVYTFAGETVGALDALFNMQDLVGRYIVIKSMRLDYYVADDQVDQIALFDGVVANRETSDSFCRINRVFDIYDDSMLIDMQINGSPVGIFGNNAVGVSYPADLFLDNIYYKFPEKIQTWTMSVNGNLFDTPSTDVGHTAVTVHVKATFECYLI